MDINFQGFLAITFLGLNHLHIDNYKHRPLDNIWLGTEFFSENFSPSGGIEKSQIITLLTVNSIRWWEFKPLALATRCPATASWYLHEWEVKASLESGWLRSLLPVIKFPAAACHCIPFLWQDIVSSSSLLLVIEWDPFSLVHTPKPWGGYVQCLAVHLAAQREPWRTQVRTDFLWSHKSC